MPRPRSIPDQALVELVLAGGGTWRHTALTAALCRIFNCSERTARRTLATAVRGGLILNHDGLYIAADGERPFSGDWRAPKGVQPPRIPARQPIGARRRVDRHAFLGLMGDRTWRYGELIEAVCRTFGCQTSTARRNLHLAIAYGYIQRGDRGYQLTAEAATQLSRYGCLVGVEGVRFARFCSGRPGLSVKKTRGGQSAKISFVHCVIQVRVAPAARRAGVVGRYGEGWRIRVAAAPQGGAANQELTELLASLLGVRPSAIFIVAGRSSRTKRVRVDGISLQDVERALGG